MMSTIIFLHSPFGRGRNIDPAVLRKIQGDIFNTQYSPDIGIIVGIYTHHYFPQFQREPSGFILAA